MTTATIRSASIRPGSVQPRGINLLAMRFGAALVNWGRIRTERAAIRDNRQRAMLDIDQLVAEREHATRRYGIAN